MGLIVIKDEMYEVNCSHWYLIEGIIHIRIVCYIYVVDKVRVGSFSGIKPSPTVRDVQIWVDAILMILT